MSFEWSGEEPLFEKRRHERDKRRLDELHFKWLDGVATGNRTAALQAALDWNDLAAEVYGQQWLDDVLPDLKAEPANGD
jgi:hypothetical protein